MYGKTQHTTVAYTSHFYSLYEIRFEVERFYNLEFLPSCISLNEKCFRLQSKNHSLISKNVLFWKMFDFRVNFFPYFLIHLGNTS